MSKLRTSSLVLSLALALLAPHAALGGHVADPAPTAPSETAAPAPAVGADGDEADGAAGGAEGDGALRPKRKGNAFARALAAPFRALARLFGGGRKADAAKKSAPAPAQQTAAATQAVTTGEAASAVAPPESKAAPAESAARAKAQATAQAEPAPLEVAKVEVAKVEPVMAPAAPASEAVPARPGSSVEARAAEGVRIVRPSEGEVAQGLRPKMWIPLIVGVPSDSVSQGRALLQHGYVQEAIAELQVAATTVGPQLAEANNLLGLAYDRLGWHRQAAEAYRRALTVAPKDYVILANLGYSLYLADDHSGALKRLKQAAKLAPAEPVISNNLGVVYARLGRHGDAYKNFAKATNEYEAHLKLAGILEDQRRDAKAARHYEAALRLQPGASAVLERLVAVYERTGARDKAETARRALGQPQRNPQKTATGGGG